MVSRKMCLRCAKYDKKNESLEHTSYCVKHKQTVHRNDMCENIKYSDKKDYSFKQHNKEVEDDTEREDRLHTISENVQKMR